MCRAAQDGEGGGGAELRLVAQLQAGLRGQGDGRTQAEPEAGLDLEVVVVHRLRRIEERAVRVDVAEDGGGPETEEPEAQPFALRGRASARLLTRALVGPSHVAEGRGQDLRVEVADLHEGARQRGGLAQDHAHEAGLLPQLVGDVGGQADADARRLPRLLDGHGQHRAQGGGKDEAGPAPGAGDGHHQLLAHARGGGALIAPARDHADDQALLLRLQPHRPDLGGEAGQGQDEQGRRHHAGGRSGLETGRSVKSSMRTRVTKPAVCSRTSTLCRRLASVRAAAPRPSENVIR